MLLLRFTSQQQHSRGRPGSVSTVQKINYMLTTIAIIFLVLWALGLVTSYTMGGLIHILLVAAVVIVLVRIIQGRKIL